MNAIKKTTFLLLLLLPFLVMPQENQALPKDTIYVKYEPNQDKLMKNWPGKLERDYMKKEGIYFNVVDENRKEMMLFYSNIAKSDTLPIRNIKNYQFSNLEEIDKKRYSWIFDHNRPPRDRNGVFQTYLIEEISSTQMVIYSVIWRSEGINK